MLRRTPPPWLCHENRQTMKHMFALLRRLLFGMSFARYFYLKCQSVSHSSLSLDPFFFHTAVCLSVRAHFTFLQECLHFSLGVCMCFY